MPALTLAAASSSPEFDSGIAGVTKEQLKQTALKAVRYLCFTHDTGPADCVRPAASWGRTEPAGTKWGERGRGFFPESQCGRQIADLAVTSLLIRDLIGDEERRMLAAIAADYLERFSRMEPPSGVYYDTQTEENAWTALGLTASLLLLEKDDRVEQWMERAKLWLFRAVSKPEDSHDFTGYSDGKTVSELVGRCCTTLPDNTAENHGFVHPSYMASSINLGGMTTLLLRLWNKSVPQHASWHRKDVYDLLKVWCDAAGTFHSVQGMDWPYFAISGRCFTHVIANIDLKDKDAALLERRALAALEKTSTAHDGQLVPAETKRYCHGVQDPSIMRERLISSAAYAYLAHRLCGIGETPSNPDDFQRRVEGVRVYPHGGTVMHVHGRGRTSFSWRNRTMVLPATREGLNLIGHAKGSMLADVEVEGRPANTHQVALRIRESSASACVLLIEDLAGRSVRRRVFFASLPDGRCLTFESITALEEIVIPGVRQGYLSIINDGIVGEYDDRRGHRKVYWQGGEQDFTGYPADSAEDDIRLDLTGTQWVNIDDKCGFVFNGNGRPVYINRHYFEVWHAIEDDLILNHIDQPGQFKHGETIAELVSLWCPEQTHSETSGQELRIIERSTDFFAARVGKFLCACNFTSDARVVSHPLVIPAKQKFPLAWNVAGRTNVDMEVNVQLGAMEPAIIEVTY
jgi:hypothetical protein